MRTGLYKRLSNEELVELYKAGESDAFEALLKNTEGLRATLAQRYLNIPGSEFEDLMSEGAIEMLSAIQNFDSKNYSSSFSTFLYSAISRHYNDMFTAAVCEKRNPGCFVQSYEQVNSNSEYEEDGDSLGSSEFSVECEDYSMVEIRDLLSRLKLSDKERVVVNLLMAGNSKPDIARRIRSRLLRVLKWLRGWIRTLLPYRKSSLTCYRKMNTHRKNLDGILQWRKRFTWIWTLIHMKGL